MGGCSILGCKNRSERKISGITFHSFPSDPEVRIKWIDATGRQNWQPKNSSKICSVHFNPDVFKSMGNNTHLEQFAVPTKFIKVKAPIEYSTNILQEVQVNTSNVPASSMSSSKKRICESDNFVSAEPSTSHVPINKRRAFEVCQNNPPTVPVLKSPRSTSIREQLAKEKEISKSRLKKLRAARVSRRRLEKKVCALEDIIAELKCKMLINTEQSEALCCIKVSDENKDFLNRFLLKDLHSNIGHKPYSSSLRKFALSLNFISPKAYSFVRKQFNACLPHPRTLYNWYKSINCEPGFTEESLNCLKSLVNNSQTKIVCSLMLDEMSIRQHLQWNGQQTIGYVNVGDNLDSDSLQVAKDALVFMVVAMNGVWKLPVGYFLTNGVSGEQRASLVNYCVKLLSECGVHVACLTFDGSPANMAMARVLGAKLDNVNNINTLIKIAGQDMVIYPDPCHMMKLVRNTLADKKTLKSPNNELISWEYIKKLHELQETEGLHLANKLRRDHINFKTQIMKVRLATQTFSKSVAEAIRFCMSLKINGFENASATAEFINYFNDIFDIMNSRKLFSYGFKKPITAENFVQIETFLDAFVNYVKELKINDQSVLSSGRKMGFLGLICCAQSLKIIFKKFINIASLLLRYLCTYKMSQDHLEIFFGSIRSKGGFNNNPTAIQFISAYRRLLIHGELKNVTTGNSNCIAFEDISILNVEKKDYVSKINTTSEKHNVDIVEADESLPIDVPDTHDYLANNNLTEFSQEVTIYIAGFIVKKMKKQLKCNSCILALISTEKISKFIFHKDVGGLNFPSQSVINVCLYAEKYIRETINTEGAHYFANKKNVPKMVFNIFKHFTTKNVFVDLKHHILEQDPLDSHVSLLIKSIALRYIEVRIHHVLKELNKTDKKVRNQLTKLILFKGQ